MRVKRIGVLTSGGDAPGMNAAIRSVVRTAIYHKIEPIGFFGGYDGLINENFRVMDHRSVANIINKGGTILKTARSRKFRTKKGRKRAYNTVKKLGIDGLVLIGGNGTYTGGVKFQREWGVPCVGVPGSIDNDISATDETIGADTAVNTAIGAIDRIRDTATSLERIFVIEVMGRESGYIAINVALGSGAENVLVPEKKFNLQKICEEITEGNIRGKVSWIVIVAEGAGKARVIAKKITQMTDLETRVDTLGHIQRGGSPTAKDRVLAIRLGEQAVNLLRKGIKGKAVGVVGGKINIVDLQKAVIRKRENINKMCNLVRTLS